MEESKGNLNTRMQKLEKSTQLRKEKHMEEAQKIEEDIKKKNERLYDKERENARMKEEE